MLPIKTILYFDPGQKLGKRDRFARRVCERIQKGEKSVEFVVRTVRLQAIANHVHSPLKTIVLYVSARYVKAVNPYSQSRKNFSVTFVRMSSCI